MDFVSGGWPLALIGVSTLFFAGLVAAKSRNSVALAVAVMLFIFSLTEVPLFIDNTLSRLPLAFAALGVILSVSEKAVVQAKLENNESET